MIILRLPDRSNPFEWFKVDFFRKIGYFQSPDLDNSPNEVDLARYHAGNFPVILESGVNQLTAPSFSGFEPWIGSK